MVAITSAIGQLYDATQQASYAGVPVRMRSSEDEVGRRVMRVLFPGQDTPRFFDLGQDDGEIKIELLLIGDDHIHQANRLRNALQTPGPATLVHSWLGRFQVVPKGRAKFADAVDKIRVTKVELTVWRYTPRTPPPVDTLTGLLDQLTDLKTQALGLLGGVLAPVAQGLALLGTVESYASQLGGYFAILVGATPSTGPIAAAAAAPIAALATAGVVPAGPGYAAAISALLAAPSAAIAGTSTPLIPAAVGPGDLATTPTPSDGRVTAGLLLQVLPSLAPAAAAPAPSPALVAATQAVILADTISAASTIAYTSDVDAATWRDQVATALEVTADATAAIAGQSGATAVACGALWTSLTAMQASWAADMNAAIGRLPAVVQLTLPGPAPVWLVAQYLSGDDPGNLVAVAMDLVARNGVRRPWQMPAVLEVLSPA